MPKSGILVVGESPSLGQSVADLLESEGFEVRVVHDLDGELPLSELAARHQLLVIASPSYYCQAGRRWLQAGVCDLPIVVVGSRDPRILAAQGVHRISLPLRTAELLATVRECLGGGPGSSPGARAESAPTSDPPGGAAERFPTGSPLHRGAVPGVAFDSPSATPPR